VIGKDLVGRVLLKDQIRSESREVLAQLKLLGIKTVMLTGDRRHAAEAVAKELGLDEVRPVFRRRTKSRRSKRCGPKGAKSR